MVWLLAVFPLSGAEWHVAVGGDDRGAGDAAAPLGSLREAQERAQPGDVVLIHGGRHVMKEEDISRRERIWAYGVELTKSGLPGRPITYAAAPGERPVFDFSAVRPPDLRVHAFEVRASHLVLRGFDVTGVQVTIRGHTQSVCISHAKGDHNRYEDLRMYDGMGIGFYLSAGSGNLVLNCDAWNNHDPVSEGGKGGNVDGFGCHPRRGGVGNVFRGCRAWFNADDGFDCINAWEAVRFENCLAWRNGATPDGPTAGDGNGFKAGGYGLRPPRGFPDPAPRHVVSGCVAALNKSSGFYANHHPGGCDWENNSAWGNTVNFNFLGRDFSAQKSVPGGGHRISGNLSSGARRQELANLDQERSELRDNVFGGLSARDFESVDVAELAAPRKEDGSLPEMRFMKRRDGRPAAEVR